MGGRWEPARKCLKPHVPAQPDKSKITVWVLCFQQATADGHQPDEMDVSGQTGGKPAIQTV